MTIRVFTWKDVRLPLQLLIGLTLLAMTVCVCCYAYRLGSPLLRGDDWYYTNTIVKSYLEGHLGIMDFFYKRGPDENAQPINRLVLLALVKWFQMDFTLQGLLGALLAAACVVLLTFLAWREPRPAGQPEWARALLPFGLGAVILSLNAYGDYGWPLVTALVYTGTLGISLYLYFAAGLSERGAWFRLGLLTFAVLVLLDTFATLAVLGGVLLLLARMPSSPHRWRAAAAALAAFLGLFIYQHLFTWLTGTANSPLGVDALLNSGSYLLHHLDSAWKLLIAPFGAALLEPRPQQLHPWEIMAVPAVLVWPLHIWFWWRFVRERHNRVAFVAGGLMLYTYGTVVGMMVSRIPEHDFDYLLQPRYVAFYQLQLVAMLLMWSRMGASRLRPRDYGVWAAGACTLLLGLNVYSALLAWKVQPYVDKYNQRVAAQMQALAKDPAHPPQGCLPDITPCKWPEAPRRQVIQILQSHQLNAFSAGMRARHAYLWPDPAVRP
ncbi:MAG TPA: hypothetical protein VKT74_05850 [Gammaproteobacteria bacterium]|nr:hypothetical protein [Gammaproteobacteria bacterium]